MGLAKTKRIGVPKEWIRHMKITWRKLSKDDRWVMIQDGRVVHPGIIVAKRDRAIAAKIQKGENEPKIIPLEEVKD